MSVFSVFKRIFCVFFLCFLVWHAGAQVPTAFTATDIKSDEFAAQWQAIDNATYEIDLMDSGGTLVQPTVTTASTTYTFQSLTGSTTYGYQVRAVVAGTASPNSNTVTVQTLPNPPSWVTPDNLTATSFDLNWSPAFGATFEIDLLNSSGAVIGQFTASTNSYTVTGRTPGTTYQLIVRTISGGQTSANSSAISVTTLPNAPTASLASEVSDMTFQANWNLVPTATYELEVFDYSDALLYPTITIPSGTSSYEVGGLEPDSTYSYKVRAVIDGRKSAFSTPIKVKMEGVRHSFFLVSAVRTVAGEQPENEFFDILFNFHFKQRLVFMGSLDVALSNVETETVGSVQKQLTEATGFLFWKPKWPGSDDYRTAIIGGGMKIFNGISYFGAQLGNLEMGRSSLHSSYVTAGYLRKFHKRGRMESIDRGLYLHNLYVEFAFHDENLPIIKDTRIKGGVLIPLHRELKFEDELSVRIAIEVPIGGVHKFK